MHNATYVCECTCHVYQLLHFTPVGTTTSLPCSVPSCLILTTGHPCSQRQELNVRFFCISFSIGVLFISSICKSWCEFECVKSYLYCRCCADL